MIHLGNFTIPNFDLPLSLLQVSLKEDVREGCNDPSSFGLGLKVKLDFSSWILF